MRKPGFIRDEILMFIGVLVMGFAGLLFLGAAVSKTNSSHTVPMLVFTTLVMLGGVAAFAVGLRFRRKEKQLRRVLGVLRSCANKVTIASLASTCGYSRKDVRNSVIFLISHGFVALKFDADRDQVYSPEARRSRQGWLRLPGTCPNCQAPTPTVIEAMDNPNCEYCGAPLPAQRIEDDHPEQLQPARDETALHSNVFAGSWVVLVVLFIVFWPAAVVYLMNGLKRHGGVKVFRP